MSGVHAQDVHSVHAREDLPEGLDELQRRLASLRQRIWRSRDACDMRRARQIEIRISQIAARARG